MLNETGISAFLNNLLNNDTIYSKLKYEKNELLNLINSETKEPEIALKIKEALNLNQIKHVMFRKYKSKKSIIFINEITPKKYI